MINKVFLPPEKVNVVGYLDDSILEACNDSIKSYNNQKARETLGKFNSFEKQLTGSSSFMQAYLINSGLLRTVL